MLEGSSKRSGAEQQQIRLRQEMIEQLRSHYGEFGERVLQTVIQEGLHRGGLRQLVHRVCGRVVSDLQRQHETLREFIHRHGETEFLSRARRHHPLRLMRTPKTEQPLPSELEPTAEPYMGAARAEGTSLRITRAGPHRLVRLPQGQVIEDRRSGKERRSGLDRRQSVETVFKNRRFGGERRSGRDRRQRLKKPHKTSTPNLST